MQVVKHSERDAEKLLVSKIKKLGGRAYKTCDHRSSRLLGAGVPDRIIILPGGRVEFVEMKSESGMLSVLQKICISHLRALGCHVEVLYGVKDVDTYVTRVKKMIKNGGTV